MIFLHKILPIFVLPIILVIIVILIELIRNKKKLVYIAIGFSIYTINPYILNNFFKLVEGSEKIKSISDKDGADAIVVKFRMVEINEIDDSTYVE